MTLKSHKLIENPKDSKRTIDVYPGTCITDIEYKIRVAKKISKDKMLPVIPTTDKNVIGL